MRWVKSEQIERRVVLVILEIETRSLWTEVHGTQRDKWKRDFLVGEQPAD